MDENLETKDQVQKDSPNSNEVKVEKSGPKVIKKDQAPQEQSDKGEVKEEIVDKPKLYKTPDGRDLTADEIYDEYNKLSPEFTRRSQRLADYERKEAEIRRRNESEADDAIAKNKLLEGVDPTVREAIVELVKPVIQDALLARDRDSEKKEQQRTFDKRLEELEKKYPGGNGLPKFSKVDILKKMQDPSNEIYDPEVLYQRINWDSFMDYHIKNAIKGKSGTPSTESTSTEAPRKPSEVTPARTWSEASRNAFNRS